ncbi:pyruvate, phosphate dikinase [Vulcanimicrobium alpinum]|uniref:Pyruvate, phosphate dikinase n=2 Tax=Vulcanimicrobium alpinum TaxID=3016050 RepID=A0AAN2C8S1_UNVUL|nr:pyruvate, phosphate dikinase [Vulcanimicrobium alpinum]
MRDLLGGKGAGLAEMTRAGLPVPPGFTITTETCLAYFDSGGHLPPGLGDEVRAAMDELESRTGKQFGVAANPLLVSVRSGARVSMPGMMDTILNLGLNDETVAGLARLTSNERFAYDAYRRFMAMFGNVVLGIEKDQFDRVVDEAKQKAGVATDPELTADRWKEVIAQFREIVRIHTGAPFPQDVHEQLELAIEAVFDSWNSKRAIDYRKYNKIPDDWGTAVSVCSMVFGNLGDDSGTGVAFTRDPNTGEKLLFGEYLRNAQGEDVVAGIRTPMKIADLQNSQPDVYAQFVAIAHQLETHYKDMQDLEFTVERGKLWMLQTRSGKRSAEAAVKIALDLARDGLITQNDAVARVDAASLDQLFHARIDPNEQFEVAGVGLNASPGAATGQVVFDADTAAERGAKGESVILVRVETAPDDVHGMIAAKGVLTSRGGATSHAAVVARGMGRPCVAGFDAMTIDGRAKTATIGTHVLHEGDWITIDGTTGKVVVGKLTLIPPPSQPPEWLASFLGWADAAARMEVWANADTPDDAQRARDLGATGIGLCRTEHMFMQKERLPVVQRMIISDTPQARAKALAQLLPFQKDDFAGILAAMAGYPVTIRLLDPPLHEFLPSLEQLLVETTELRITKGESDPVYVEKMRVLGRVRALHEQNPMLGLRVCRLGIVYPEIYAMQVRAIFEASCELRARGVDARPDVMIPGVGTREEMQTTYDAVKSVADEVILAHGTPVPYRIGTMIELPRACVVAGELASIAQFFSFGTNDLTQTTYGYSRDDAESSFIPRYLEKKILKDDPFQVLDRVGVGGLMRLGVERGRAARGDLKIGICGEHGGEPSSVAFCNELGLDYVSCSPYRVPIARLAAAQAALA